MAVQRLHSAMAPIDVLTREELAETLHKGMDSQIREWYRGIELQRFPRVIVTASGTTVNVGAMSNDMAPVGPEQGDLWVIRRVIVKSNDASDTAVYTVFKGSSPSDTANAYSFVQLLEGFGSAGRTVNMGYYPGNKSVYCQPGEQIYALVSSATSGNQYMLDGEAVRVPAEMKGKVLI